MPLLPELLAVIDATPSGQMTYLVTEFGKPYRLVVFGNWFYDRCDDASLTQCSAHGITVGRHNWNFASSDADSQRAAAVYMLIETAELNDIDPQAWLADMLARLQDQPATRIDELLPWNWKQPPQQKASA